MSKFTMSQIINAIKINERPAPGDRVICWEEGSDGCTCTCTLTEGWFIKYDEGRCLIRTAYDGNPVYHYDCAVKISNPYSAPDTYEEGV